MVSRYRSKAGTSSKMVASWSIVYLVYWFVLHPHPVLLVLPSSCSTRLDLLVLFLDDDDRDDDEGNPLW